jgi:hypothetical protein
LVQVGDGVCERHGSAVRLGDQVQAEVRTGLAVVELDHPLGPEAPL